MPTRRPARGRWLRLAAGGLLAASIPAAARGQACPLCYQSAAASSAQFISALKSGIIVLIIPVVLIFAGITYASYRKRDLCVDEEGCQAERGRPGTARAGPAAAQSLFFRS